MHNNKSVVKNYIYNLIYEVFSLFVPLLTTPYVSRVLGASGIGIYSYTLSIATYFLLMSKLGFQTYGQLVISENRDDTEKMTRSFFEIVIAKCITTCISLLLYSIVCFYDYQYRFYYLLLIISFVASLTDFTWFFQGLEEFKKIVFRNMIIKISSIICIFLLIKSTQDLFLYFIIVEGSALLGNIAIMPFLKKYLCRISLKQLNIIYHIKKSLPYFITTIATTIYLSIDKSMIGWITKSNSENGFYEQAHKIEQVAVTVVTSLSVVTMPRIAYLFKTDNIDGIKSLFNSTVRFILFISIPMSFGLMSISKIFIPWYLGDDYYRSIALLQIFSFLIIIIGLNNAVGKQLLMPMKMQKEYNISVCIGAIINIILNIILINLYSSYGAAIASVISELMILIIFSYFSRKVISFEIIIKESYRFLISGILMAAFLLVINNNKWIEIKSSLMVNFIEIIIGIMLYILTLLILRDDYLLSSFKKIKKRLIKKKSNSC